MALKFRRRQKIFPGFYLNFSANGISATFGIKGLNVNVNKTGTYLNTGIPGTGIYDRIKLSGNNDAEQDLSHSDIEQSNKGTDEDSYVFIPKKLEGEIKSRNANEVTSHGLADLKETVLAAYKEREDIENEIVALEQQVQKAKRNRIIAKVLIVGFLTKKFDNVYNEKREYLNALNTQLSECRVSIDIEMDEAKLDRYEILKTAFENLMGSKKVWDMTSSAKNKENKSAANETVTRNETQIGYRRIPLLNADFEAMFFENKNGSDAYIYPGFAVLFDDDKNFGLIELKDLNIKYSDSRFLEEQKIPEDAIVLGETWAKVNKDGTPDKRFKGNYKIPIVKYGKLKFQSNSGIYDVFVFSNSEKAKSFDVAYEMYKD